MKALTNKSRCLEANQRQINLARWWACKWFFRYVGWNLNVNPLLLRGQTRYQTQIYAQHRDNILGLPQLSPSLSIVAMQHFLLDIANCQTMFGPRHGLRICEQTEHIRTPTRRRIFNEFRTDSGSNVSRSRALLLPIASADTPVSRSLNVVFGQVCPCWLMLSDKPSSVKIVS